VLQIIFWVLFIYGFLSLIQDVANEITYKKIEHNMKIVLFANDLEKNIESFIKELYNLKNDCNYKQIVVIDLNNEDNFEKIEKRFYNEEIYVKLLRKEEVGEYLKNILK